MRHWISRLAPVLALCLLTVATSAAARTITCESKNYRYRHCRVDTDGRVRLVKRISQAPCRQGRSWGYDRRGIWVDDGCAARFEVGRGGGGGRDDDDDDGGGMSAGTAAAIVGGAVLLGALASSSSSSNSQAGYPSHQDGAVPNWAIGTFQGYDSAIRANVELTITPDGAVSGYTNGSRFSGSFRNSRIDLGNVAFDVRPAGSGMQAVQTNNPGNVISYSRIR